MNATVEDLVATIGEQTVELRLLRQALSDLQVASNLKDQEITSLKESIEAKTSEIGGMQEIIKNTNSSKKEKIKVK